MVLPGQETLIASWRALARLSRGARLIRSTTAVAAVFPSWASLNNAILLTAPEGGAAAAAAQSTSLYAQVGVDAWAFWVPSRATDLDAPDDVREVGEFKRDTTTLVMQAVLSPGLQAHDGVVRRRSPRRRAPPVMKRFHCPISGRPNASRA